MRFSRAGLAVIALLSSAVTAIAAPVVILSGDANGNGPGSLVEDTMIISLPAGGVLVFNDATGQTRTLAGPYEGPIGAEPETGEGQSGIDRLLAARSAEEARLGAIRTAPGQSARDIDVISIAQTSVQCVRDSATAQLWRPDSMNADSHLTIVDPSAGREHRLIWLAGDDKLAWPAEMPLRSGATYRLDLDIAARAIDVTLYVVPSDVADTDQVSDWMGDVGCRRQALILLDQMVN